MMDLDGLKAINDRFGHFHGDRCPAGVGEMIRTGVRRIDTAARYGGDEFVVAAPGDRADRRVRPGREDPPGVEELAHRRSPALDIRTSLSIGVVVYPRDGRTVDDLMISADRAMYALEAPGQEPRRRLRAVAIGGPADGDERRWQRSGACRQQRDRPAQATPPAPAGEDGRRVASAHAASRRAPSRRRRRPPRVDQRPTPSRSTRPSRSRADDAEELGDVTDRPAARLRLRADRQPDRYGPRPAHRRARRRRGGEVFASGMAAIHAALALGRVGRRPDRLHPGVYGTTRSQLLNVLARLGRRRRLRRRHRPRRGRGGPGRGADPGPLRRDDLEPDDRRRRHRRAGRRSPIATARCSSSTTRSPRRTSAGRSSSGRTSSSSRPRSS